MTGEMKIVNKRRGKFLARVGFFTKYQFDTDEEDRFRATQPTNKSRQTEGNVSTTSQQPTKNFFAGTFHRSG
jgi:hypothetical protein